MYGYVKVGAAVPLLQVGNCDHNVRQMEHLLRKAGAEGIQLLAFPELAVTGYTCMDLFAQECLLRNAEQALLELVRRTEDVDTLCIAGMPLRTENRLFNTAVVFQKGKIAGIVPKTYLPNYREFQERRWFSSGAELRKETARIGDEDCPISTQLLFTAGKMAVGIEICEDLWTPVPPGALLAMQGATILVNISASNELTGKNDYLKSLIRQQSARCMAGYVYVSSGFGESTTDLVFAGKSFIAENGVLLAESERFPMQEKLLAGEIDVDYLLHDRQVNTCFTQGLDMLRPRVAPVTVPVELAENSDFAPARPVDPMPFVPATDPARDERCEEVFHIQVNGLAGRLAHTRTEKVIIGVSGGLDSTLALLVAVMTFDALGKPRRHIVAVTMPGYGTTERTCRNASQLAFSLGVDFRNIPIMEACRQHFRDIGHDGETQDITYENTQARERTQILMDLANLENGLVVGTGDLSELALGWATYNGDHMSMYAVNAGVPKTLVKHLVKWVAQRRADGVSGSILADIVDTPVSPELIPPGDDGAIRQKTEELVGPYELHDFFLYHFIRFGAPPEKICFLAQQAFRDVYSPETIRKWLRVFFSRFFSQQFKRSCLPDGPKIGSVSLSPRGDWRMPSDASATLWLKAVDEAAERRSV
ncbi:MAG: NAD(+) synthase [Tannerella sp.]|jgi:NAD+ synthase (glutamine-hydrolysing)|nr:NAD(+) synthase [Tannerella sp.]